MLLRERDKQTHKSDQCLVINIVTDVSMATPRNVKGRSGQWGTGSKWLQVRTHAEAGASFKGEESRVHRWLGCASFAGEVFRWR